MGASSAASSVHRRWSCRRGGRNHARPRGGVMAHGEAGGRGRGRSRIGRRRGRMRVNGFDGAVARCEERRERDGGGTGGEAGSCALLVHNKLCKPITNLALCTLRDVALLTKHGASASRRLPCVVQSAPAQFCQRQEGPSGRRGRSFGALALVAGLPPPWWSCSSGIRSSARSIDWRLKIGASASRRLPFIA